MNTHTFLKQLEERGIDSNREEVLNQLAMATYQAYKKGRADIIFICTHNSRRSHFSHVWYWYFSQAEGLNFIHTYSGGTEATAFNPRAVAALKRAGLQVTQMDESVNPKYIIHHDQANSTLECFSKEFDQPPNPTSHFIAAMTCSDVDEGCPVVPGATDRIPLHYIDPKISDDTPDESTIYSERCLQIAAEMKYAIEKVKQLMS